MQSHNLLVGSSTDHEKALFFDMLQNGNLYFGFGRKDTIWGFSTLIKIAHSRTWSSSIMGSAQGQTGRFYDRNTDDIISIGNTTGEDSVFIAYIDKTADDTVFGNYVFLLEGNSGIGNLSLEYMNEEWVRIKGLQSDYMEQTLVNNPLVNYKYVLFSYDKDITSVTSISLMDDIQRPEIKQPIKLMYSSSTNATAPTTSFDSSQIGSLYRHINNIGESYISGIESTFITTGQGVIEDSGLTSATFFITDANGIVLQDGLTYYQKLEDNDEISLVFSYDIAGSAISETGRLKLSSVTPSDQLAVFYEQFEDGQEVSDVLPAPLKLSYLKSDAFNSSLLQVNGFVKVNPFLVNGNSGSVTGSTSVFDTGLDLSTYSSNGLADKKLQLLGLEAGTYSIVSNTSTGTNDTVTVSETFPSTLSNQDFFIREAGELNFARRVDNQTTYDILFGKASDPVTYPGVNGISISNNITVSVDGDSETSVDYAITSDAELAKKWFFDLVEITKSIQSTEVSTDIYRELIICFNPKLSNGKLATATEITHTDLFDTTNHKYDLGTVIYLARKEPVFRKHLQSPETFKVLF